MKKLKPKRSRAQSAVAAIRESIERNRRMNKSFASVYAKYAPACLQFCDEFDKAWAEGAWDDAVEAAMRVSALNFLIAQTHVAREPLLAQQKKRAGAQRASKEKIMTTVAKLRERNPNWSQKQFRNEAEHRHGREIPAATFSDWYRELFSD